MLEQLPPHPDEPPELDDPLDNPEHVREQLLAQFLEQDKEHPVEQLLAQFLEQDREHPVEQLLAQFFEQDREHPVEQLLEQAFEQDREHVPVQLEQLVLHPKEHVPEQLEQLVLHPKEQEPVQLEHPPEHPYQQLEHDCFEAKILKGNKDKPNPPIIGKKVFAAFLKKPRLLSNSCPSSTILSRYISLFFDSRLF